MLIVMPKELRIRNPISIESGMAIPTKSAFLNPKKKKSTSTTNITPEIMLFSKLATWFLVLSLWSFVKVTLKLDGK